MNESFNTYLFEYRFEGATWCLEIKAANAEEAKLRARQPLHYVGEVKMKVQARSFLSRIAAAIRSSGRGEG